MELRDLKTFERVASSLSFRRAAEALHAAQSTVSARIACLEEELGIRLFDRLGSRVNLTEAGLRLLDYARKILDLEGEARAWVMEDAALKGALVVRVPETLCTHRLGKAIQAFRRQFPWIKLSFISCTLDGLEKDLRTGVTDLAYVYIDGVTAADLQAECLGTESLVLACAPGHPLAQQAALGVRSLQGVNLLLAKGDCSYRKLLEGLLAESGVEPGTGMEFSCLAALKVNLAAGLGVAILPTVAIQPELQRGELVPLPWEGAPLETGVLMIHHRNKWVSPPLQAFMELTRRDLLGALQGT